MIRRSLLLIIAMILLAIGQSYAAPAADTPSFAKAVIHQAISFMPQELQAKLTAVEKDIVTSAIPASYGKKPAEVSVYFVDAGEGSGPNDLADLFRKIQRQCVDKTPYSKLAPTLGQLSGCVISLCQPYHTDKSEFGKPGHARFEKDLDAASATLTAEFDGYQKVTNPSDFARETAILSNELLRKLVQGDGGSASAVNSAAFGNASNRLADCWQTLLSGDFRDGSKSVVQNAATSPSPASYIGNKRSGKFHLPSCRYLPAESNRVYLTSRDDAIAQRFVPCKVCNP